MKTCTKCGEEKPLDAFYRSSRGACCKTCKTAIALAWRKANADRARLSDAARYRRTVHDWRARVYARRRQDPAGQQALSALRRQARRRRVPWYAPDRVNAYYRLARWLRRHGIEVHVDHYLPLRGRNVCGLHVQDNLRLAFAQANLRKGARVPDGPLLGQLTAVRLRPMNVDKLRT